jgi:RNA polymerase sigma-70 factor (ECF subfamily)
MNDDEKLWITRARRGDGQAFAQLVEAYQRPVFNLCYRMLGDPAEAEDAAQETFIRAYTRLDSYDPARKFSSWLLAVASHYCIDRMRRRHFSLVSWDDLPPWRWLPDPDPQPEDVTLRHEAQRHVQELLDRLPAEYRAAVVLRYWHDLSYEEIAQALGSTLPAIKSRLFRARQMLAEAAAQADTIATANKPAFTNHADALQGARPLHG